MSQFKHDTFICPKCTKTTRVSPKDFEAGFYICVNKTCGAKNTISGFYYDESILKGLPQYGYLVAYNQPSERYPLHLGENIVGRGMAASVQLQARATGSQGLPTMSKLHCTIEVKFDRYKGQLLYILSDGAIDSQTNNKKNSVNGTFKNNKQIQSIEAVFLSDKDTLNLGGDIFRFEAYIIPDTMLQTYKKHHKDTDPEGTETTE